MYRTLRTVAALVLALIWLPATLHCGLETAGVIGEAEACCHEHDTLPATADHCDADGCKLVESGDYRVAQNLLNVSAPSTVVCLLCLIEIRPAPVAVREIEAVPEVESPPEFRRTWQFIARAALSPRAPSFVS